MDPALEAQLHQQWDTLPKPIKNAILDGRYKQVVEEVCTDLLVSEEHVTAIEVEVLLVLLGITSQKVFKNALANIPGLHEDSAEKVGEFVQTKLFALLSPFLPEDLPSTEGAATTTPQQTSGLQDYFESSEAVNKRFIHLPEAARTYMLSPELQSAYNDIMLQNDISKEGKRSVGVLMAQVLVGLQKKEAFKEQVASTAEMSPEKADAFMLSMQEKIFHPVQKSMLSTMGQQPTNATPTSAPAAGKRVDPYKEPIT